RSNVGAQNVVIFGCMLSENRYIRLETPEKVTTPHLHFPFQLGHTANFLPIRDTPPVLGIGVSFFDKGNTL
ncbi:hypothetical protein, partial [Vibrio aestuarianus]|uniref:hypothetical protein n=1 Tax=Vibrio aestuarianus TaxID=28171 RepID=UPI001C12D767